MLHRGYSPLYTGHFHSNDYCRVCAVIVLEQIFGGTPNKVRFENSV